MSFEPSADELRTARYVAWRIGSRWQQVEVEDLQSHLYLWLLEHTGTVEKWRTQDGGRGQLYVTLKRTALKYCTRETAARIGRPLTSENFYTPALVTRAMPYMFEDWPETQVRQNPVTGQTNERIFEHGNALAILADISGAYHGLPKEMREVLAWRFRDGLTLEEIGELRQVTKESARMLVDRCVKRLCDRLGGERL